MEVSDHPYQYVIQIQIKADQKYLLFFELRWLEWK